MYGADADFGFDVGADGRFAEYPQLPSYWIEPDRTPLLIRQDGRPAGFILLNTVSVRGAMIDHAVAEFFVMRKFRRTGVGAIAAQTVFTRYPGRWELAIAAVNAGGRRFWPTVLAGTPGMTGLETVDLDEGPQSRRLLSFRVDPGRR